MTRITASEAKALVHTYESKDEEIISEFMNDVYSRIRSVATAHGTMLFMNITHLESYRSKISEILVSDGYHVKFFPIRIYRDYEVYLKIFWD